MKNCYSKSYHCSTSIKTAFTEDSDPSKLAHIDSLVNKIVKENLFDSSVRGEKELMMVQAAPQIVKDTEALVKDQRSHDKATKNPLVITLKNLSVDSVLGEGSSGPRSEDASLVAPSGISSKAQILQDAEYHNRKRFLAF